MTASKAAPISLSECSRDALAKKERLVGVDACRGVAVSMMVAYHLCYDLAYIGFAPWSRFEMQTHAVWIGWRTLIVTSFLLLVGFSLTLRAKSNPSPRAFWWRWIQIAAAAVLVSVVSALFSGQYWIYFGILHFIAVSILAGWLLQHAVKSAASLAAIGVMLIAAGLLIASPFFDSRPMSIVGFSLHKPLTDDYVPLFPWLGVVAIGMAVGIARQHSRFVPVRLPVDVLAPLIRFLAKIGRWALTVYLVHEPVFLGILFILRNLLRAH
jgi:uncharacterized membrane protein